MNLLKDQNGKTKQNKTKESQQRTKAKSPKSKEIEILITWKESKQNLQMGQILDDGA